LTVLAKTGKKLEAMEKDRASRKDEGVKLCLLGGTLD